MEPYGGGGYFFGMEPYSNSEFIFPDGTLFKFGIYFSGWNLIQIRNLFFRMEPYGGGGYFFGMEPYGGPGYFKVGG
jgi:hypothetical protein